MSLSNFEILSKIGEGAYSIVYKAKRLSDGQIYAVKKVKIQKLTEKEKKNALNEIRIMASINHSNVISYKEAFFDEADQALCLIMEFADSGDLWQKIQRCIKRSTRLSEKMIWSIFIQVVRGLKALHQLGVFHRDLKSANIFLNKDGSVKLGDMNVSKVAKDGFLRTQTGTPYYASPEVWKDMKYNNKSDIWSLGCVLYETITLRPPFRAKNMEELYEKVITGFYDPIPKNYSKDISILLKLLLNTNPNDRLNCDQILGLEIVTKHFIEKALSSSSSSLIKSIKIPKEINMLSHSLPQANYEGFEGIHTERKERCESDGMPSPKNHSENEKRRKSLELNIRDTKQSMYDEKNINSSIIKLPKIKMNAGAKSKHFEVHKLIENSSERLRKIKEIYLSPTSILLSPQHHKSSKNNTLKKSVLY